MALAVPYFTETGRLIYGADIDYLLLETGRRCTIRPIQEEGRLSNVVQVFSETAAIALSLTATPAVEIEATVCSDCWDLREMMPRKFRDAPVMMDYLHAINTMVNAISCRINTLGELVSVDDCPKRYLGHLAALIAYKLKNQRNATAIEQRNQLKMAVEMYKIKGTYRVLDIMFYLIGLNAKIYDLWTKDYVVFERQDAHRHSGYGPEYGGFIIVDDTIHVDDGYYMDETVPGGGIGVSSPWHFDSGLAWKSPHYDLVIKLDRIINYQGYFNRLFVSDLYDMFADIVEEYTPINTIPHFYMELLCQTYEDYLSYMIPSSQVKTCLMNAWAVSGLYFDQVAPDDIYTDQIPPNDIYLDQSFSAMLSLLTVIKIGNGNKGGTPVATDTALANIVWTGTVSAFSIDQDKITFKATVPAGVVLTGVSELGIFNSATGALTIESFFLDLDKPSAAILEITVEVLR